MAKKAEAEAQPALVAEAWEEIGDYVTEKSWTEQSVALVAAETEIDDLSDFYKRLSDWTVLQEFPAAAAS